MAPEMAVLGGNQKLDVAGINVRPVGAKAPDAAGYGKGGKRCAVTGQDFRGSTLVAR